MFRLFHGHNRKSKLFMLRFVGLVRIERLCQPDDTRTLVNLLTGVNEIEFPTRYYRKVDDADCPVDIVAPFGTQLQFQRCDNDDFAVEVLEIIENKPKLGSGQSHQFYTICISIVIVFQIPLTNKVCNWHEVPVPSVFSYSLSEGISVEAIVSTKVKFHDD